MYTATTITAISALLTTVYADSVCGQGNRFMLALECGDGTTTLHCAPNNLKGGSCTNPNLKWSEAKCKQKGGYVNYDVDYSGCYSEGQDFWTNYGGQNVSHMCNTPLTVQEKPTNLGFESGDLSGWTFSGPSPPDVMCDASAPGGSCYARLSTTGTRPGSSPNKLERGDLMVVNSGGCNGDSKTLTFWYKFSTGDYLPFNDYLHVKVSDEASVLFQQVVDVQSVGNFGNSGWKKATVSIGEVPAGTSLSVSISAEVKNVRDGAVSSYGYIDEVKIENTQSLPLESSSKENTMVMTAAFAVLALVVTWW